MKEVAAKPGGLFKRALAADLFDVQACFSQLCGREGGREEREKAKLASLLQPRHA